MPSTRMNSPHDYPCISIPNPTRTHQSSSQYAALCSEAGPRPATGSRVSNRVRVRPTFGEVRVRVRRILFFLRVKVRIRIRVRKQVRDLLQRLGLAGIRVGGDYG